MPINVPNNSISEWTFEGTQNGQTIMSVFHYFNSGSNIADWDNFVANEFGPWLENAGNLYDQWRQAISADITGIRIYGQAIWPTRFRLSQFTPGFDVGARAGAALPQNAASAITKQCDEAGRKFVGTLHMPGLLVADNNGGNTSAAYNVLAANVASAIPTVYVQPGTGMEMAPVLWRRSDPANSPTITTAYHQRTVRVNRRRTVGLGT